MFDANKCKYSVKYFFKSFINVLIFIKAFYNVNLSFAICPNKLSSLNAKKCEFHSFTYELKCLEPNFVKNN